MKARFIILVLCGLLALPAARAAMPEIQHWTTASGTRVYFVATSVLPIVDLSLVFDAGAARDGNKSGLAALTSRLLTDGTAELDAGAIARRFERYGARVATDNSRDTARLTVRSLSASENLQPTLDHLIEVLSNPTFPAAALERRRAQALVGLRQAQQNPGRVAERAFAQALFGDHPYANLSQGNISGVQAVTRDDVQAFHDRYYVAANAIIAIVGDLQRPQAESIATRLAQALKPGSAAPALPPVPDLKRAKIVRRSFDSSQTHILIGAPAISRTNSHYIPLYVANHVLGGSGLVSVLADEMRAQRGLSYSTSSTLITAAQRGWFELASSVRNDKLDESLQVLRNILQRYAASGPSRQRLEAAKRNITGSFPLRLDSNQDILAHIVMIGFYGLPLDYLQTFPKRVEAVSQPQTRQAFQAHVDPSHMVTVLVGPKAVIGDVSTD
ncbi:M16 family metallopeptidase [Nitrococcus mobilis]|uniref:Peptidase M16-like protein n=1 Tax=Nitrococcus mobilis Nb-231 TaxID=314278 RepID=A4BP12_9GAMM|nr:pitrilysin family protein [Nitrococcus mobilis]EAR22313.1 Peptidase M16-like protein [Nitrococcus mobilis Nb-231]